MKGQPCSSRLPSGAWIEATNELKSAMCIGGSHAGQKSSTACEKRRESCTRWGRGCQVRGQRQKNPPCKGVTTKGIRGLRGSSRGHQRKRRKREEEGVTTRAACEDAERQAALEQRRQQKALALGAELEKGSACRAAVQADQERERQRQEETEQLSFEKAEVEPPIARAIPGGLKTDCREIRSEDGQFFWKKERWGVLKEGHLCRGRPTA
ncbi:hypothetical protein GOP47_0013006 [Adiantum capillus-veneris]|uniref:Uncharacterized protein n=1 Tax=Adiantum capillus-veneris TaxID=13818 RepID=A0A9D4URS2_ADICA|nr:hypothetical protein GOP47_0013006 [Adiantum capillus-veneris]